jgi:hypothetical protein
MLAERLFSCEFDVGEHICTAYKAARKVDRVSHISTFSLDKGTLCFTYHYVELFKELSVGRVVQPVWKFLLLVVGIGRSVKGKSIRSIYHGSKGEMVPVFDQMINIYLEL